MLRRGLFAVLAFAVAACSSPTDPKDAPSSIERGRLSGAVTIGPNCPGPVNDNNPCPTPPEAYAARKILVYNEAASALLFTVDIDSTGHYAVDLAPGTYTVNLKGSAADHADSLPAKVDIRANTVTVLNVSVDTGIR